MFEDNEIEAPEVELDQAQETPDREPVEKTERDAPKSIRESLKDAIKVHSTEEKPQVEKPKREKVVKPAALNGAAEPPQRTDSKPEGQTETTQSGAPNGFSEQAKAEWARTPPSVQQAITKRIADLDVGVKQIQQRYGGIHQTVQRLNPIFQKYGQTPDQGMAIQAAWAEAIEQNPAAAIQALANQYKVDLSKLSQGQGVLPQQQQQYAQKPAWATSIEERLEGIQQSKTEEAFNAWKANKPHAEALRETMATILAGAVATQNPVILDATGTKIDLDKVYEMASWQHPEVRAKIIKEQKDAEAKARAEDVKKSKRAGISARPSTPGDSSRKPAGQRKGLSVRESLQNAIEDLRS